jgi:hypothetical protein
MGSEVARKTRVFLMGVVNNSLHSLVFVARRRLNTDVGKLSPTKPFHLTSEREYLQAK